MIIIELKTWYGNNEFHNTEFFYAGFRNLEEVKRFLNDKESLIDYFSEDYNERITGIIYVCRDYIDIDSYVAEEIYKDYIKRIFS